MIFLKTYTIIYQGRGIAMNKISTKLFAALVALILMFATVTPITMKAATFSTAPMIETSWSHTLALKSDGTVWAWGHLWGHHLGHDNHSESRMPTQVQNLTDITAIATGNYFSLALRSDGTVWACAY